MPIDHARLALLVPLLQKQPVLHLMSEKDLYGILAVTRLLKVRRGEVLCRQGDPADSLLIVVSGRLRTARQSLEVPDAHRSLAPGDIVGETFCLDPGSRPATLGAMEDCEILLLSHGDLRTLQQRSPELAVNFLSGLLGHLVEQYYQSNQRFENLLLMPGHGPVSVILPRAQRGKTALKSDTHEGTPFRGAIDLSRLRAARGFNDRELELLLTVAPPVHYPDQAVLCREGQRASSCLFIAQGTVQIIKDLVYVPRLIATASAGAMVGHLSLIERKAQPTTVRADGEVVVLDLDREHFEKLLHARSPLGMRFQEQVALSLIRHLREVGARLDAILQQTSPARDEKIDLQSEDARPPTRPTDPKAPPPRPTRPPAQAAAESIEVQKMDESLPDRVQRLVDLWKEDPRCSALLVLKQSDLDAAIILSGRRHRLGRGLDVTTTLRLLARVGGEGAGPQITQADVLRGLQKVAIAKLALRNRALYEDPA